MKAKRLRSPIVALTIIALSLLQTTPRVSAATLIPLRVGAMAIDTAAQVFYAADQGFFTQAGLDVTLTVLPNGSAIAAATSSGALDIGFGSPSPVMLAHVGGLPIWYIAPAAVYSGVANSVLMVVKGSPIKTAADLTGKTIGVAGLHDLTQYVIQQWLDRNGGNSASVQFVELPYAQMGPALQQGRVSATGVIEPFVTQMRDVATSLGNLNSALGNRYLVAGWFAMTPYIEKNQDTVRRFTQAMRQTARWANTHPKESAAILARYSKMDPALADVISRARYAEDASFDPQLLQPVIDTMVRYGKVAPVKASDLIWPSFLPR